MIVLSTFVALTLWNAQPGGMVCKCREAFAQNMGLQMWEEGPVSAPLRRVLLTRPRIPTETAPDVAQTPHSERNWIGFGPYLLVEAPAHFQYPAVFKQSRDTVLREWGLHCSCSLSSGGVSKCCDADMAQQEQAPGARKCAEDTPLMIIEAGEMRGLCARRH